MAGKRNIFISHVHEDDALLPKLKELISGAGMGVRDASIHSDRPNHAHNPDYIKREILAPRIQWASTLVVLITHDTAASRWVNWEIKHAVEQGKKASESSRRAPPVPTYQSNSSCVGMRQSSDGKASASWTQSMERSTNGTIHFEARLALNTITAEADQLPRNLTVSPFESRNPH